MRRLANRCRGWPLAVTLGCLAACGPQGDQAAEVSPEEGPAAATLVSRGRPVDLSRSTTVPSPSYGIHAFLWWRPEDAERDLLLVKDMGFGWVKQSVGWRDVEVEPGVYDWGLRADPAIEEPGRGLDHIVQKVEEYGGLELLVRVDHQPTWTRRDGCTTNGPPDDMADFATFVGAMAERYQGKIAAYEIWNEPNLAREWCDEAPEPARYAEMLRVAYAAIKAADPGAIVVSAGYAPTGTQPPTAMPDDAYLSALYDAMGGSSDGYFDMLGLHAPGYAAPPETDPAEAAASADFGGERYFAMRHVEDMRAIQVARGDGDKQVAILEMGWTSDPLHADYAWHQVTEAQKADYLTRAYGYAAANWTPWVGPMFTIFLCNADWTEQDEQYWWCVNNPDGTPRPAFDALKTMPKPQVDAPSR
jgi:hypothetical protein